MAKAEKKAGSKPAAQKDKGTSRVTTGVTRSGDNLPAELQGPDRNGGGNSTVYKNAPIDGGRQEIILNDIIIRSAIRTEIHMDDFTSALRAAEMRYNPNRTRLYDIYEQIKLDGQLFGVVQKRILSVLNQKLYYEDAEGEEVDDMNPHIQSDAFRLVMRTILETQMEGISGIEFIPGKEMELRVIPRKHIDTKNQVIKIEQNVLGTGFDYTQLDNVWVIGEPEDLGLLRQCAPLVIYKRGALSDWANFIEIFGMPIRKIMYDPTDSVAEAKLKNMVENDGNMLAVMIPNTAQFEIIDGKTGNASGQLQGDFVKYMDDQISVVVVGNTETTGNSGTGSQAKSKTHSDQQKEIIKSDIIYCENKLNSPHFIKILQSYGWPVVEGGRFNIKSTLDVNFATQKATIDTMLSKAGLRIGEDYMYEAYDIPKPGPDEKVLTLAMPTTEDSGLKLSDDMTEGVKFRLRKPAGQTPEQIAAIVQKELKDFFA